MDTSRAQSAALTTLSSTDRLLTGPKPDSQYETKDRTLCGFQVNSKVKLIIGLIFIVVIAVTLVAGTQVSKETYLPGFSAPSFVVWFSTCWMVICFPVYLAGKLLTRPAGSDLTVRSICRSSLLVFGHDGLTWKSFVTKSLPFSALWFVANYAYLFALGFITPADATSLFASNVAFIYFLEYMILHEPFNVIRMSALFMSIGGVVMISAEDGFTEVTAVAVTFIMLSSITSAMYKVFFKKVVGTTLGAGEVSIFLSILGTTNIFFFLIVITLWYTNVETFVWTELPWTFLTANASISLIYNFFINFGIAITFPLFISLGVFLGIPLNTVTDAVFRSAQFGALKIGGTVLIMIGFLMVLTPPEWNTKLLLLAGCPQKSAAERDENEQRNELSQSVRTISNTADNIVSQI